MKKIFFLLAVVATTTLGAQTRLTGFVPQYEGDLNGKEFMKRNLSQAEIIAYAEGKSKPDIHPSNPFWSVYWKDYAKELKTQILVGMIVESGGQNLTWEQAKDMFLRLRTRPVQGKVSSTGIEYLEKSGQVVGIGKTVTRDAYQTIDGKGEQEVYGDKFRMSLVCGNTFLGIILVPSPKITPPAPTPPAQPKPPIVIKCPIVIPCDPAAITTNGAKPPIVIR